LTTGDPRAQNSQPLKIDTVRETFLNVFVVSELPCRYNFAVKLSTVFSMTLPSPQSRARVNIIEVNGQLLRYSCHKKEVVEVASSRKPPNQNLDQLSYM
jgi:hypothetical protein